MPEEALWYVIHTYSGYENKVAANLQKIVENRGLEHLIQDIKIPLEKVVEVSAGHDKKEEEHKLFPGYVLVKMILTDESWHVVRSVRGVTSFVGPGSKPIPLTSAEVEALGVDVKVIHLDFEVGDSVKVMSGPLADFIGMVNDISPDKKKAKVTVSMFGRETAIELDTSAVQPLAEG